MRTKPFGFFSRAAKMLLATLLLTLTAQTARAAEYEISTLEELREFMKAVHEEDFADDVIRLTADIDCEDGRFNTGDPEYPSKFRGTFDGQGHKIYNFVHTPTGSSQEGFGTAMFDFAETGATIKDLTLEGTLPGSYSGAYSAAFVLAVESPSGLTLDNCHFNGSVTNVYHSAALVGFASSGTGAGEVPSIILINCSANATITSTGEYTVGGLVAKGMGVKAYYCSFKGKVTSLGTVGGLIGEAINCELENCFEGGYTYIDENSNNVYSTDYTVLDNTMTTISAGWYVVNSDVTFNGDLSTNADGEVHIILCDGATLKANNIVPIGNSDKLRIYGQSQGTGTANISGSIVASSSLQIYGGTINVTGNIMCPQSGVGIYGGNVTAAEINSFRGLNFTGGTITAGSLTVDQGDIELGGATVTAGSYNVTQGNVTILTGITYYDGTGASYTAGDLSADQISAIAGKTLRAHDYRGGDIGNENNVTWAVIDTDNNDTYETLTISGTGAMEDYSLTNRPWVDYLAGIASVVIDNGVTSIGQQAFRNCTSLNSITIPASVESIGSDAFRNCTSLKSVTIPASVTYIGQSAFYGCKLTSITLNEGLTTINEEAFSSNGTTIESVSIPQSVTSIGNNAFNGTNVQNFYINNIPSKITIGENSPFKESGVIIHVFTLMKSIFENATNWSKYKGHFVDDIEITHVQSVTLDNESMIVKTNASGKLNATINPADARVKDVVFTSSNDNLVQITNAATGEFLAGSQNGTATITCTALDGSGAYATCNVEVKNYFTPAESVTLNKTTNSLEVGNQFNLTATIAPGNATFKNVSWRTSDETVATVNNGTVTAVAPGVATITAISQDGQARANCVVSVIGSCGTDVTWVLTGTSPNYTLTISGTGAMKDYGAPDDQPWKDYRSLIASVVIEDGVTSIGNMAFEGCKNANLTSVTIPASVTSIGDFAFGYCTYLASVTIPVASLTYYGVNAFDNTADGLKIYVPGSALSTYKAPTNWREYEDNFVGLYTVAFGSLPDGVSGVAPSMAAEGETVTVSFSGVPDGKVPVVSVTYGDNNDNVNDIIDNGDGTFSFAMPNGNATVTASYPIEKIPYIDADGNTEYCTDYTVLDNTMTTIPAGWYVVNSDVTFNGNLSTNADGEVNIILCDGATLTANNIEPNGNSDILCIYGQSQGTGTANISGRIVATSSLQIYGGTINAAGNIACAQSSVVIYGGNVTAAKIDGFRGLNFTGGTITAGTLQVSEEGDIKLGGATVKANSYNVTGNVTILPGITYYDGTGANYTAGNLTSSQISAIRGKILRTYDYRGGTCGKDDPDTGVDESLNVTWALAGTSPNYTLTISGTGAMKDYGVPDDQPWKDYRSLIASVVIEDGVTSIGNMAFEGCNNANLTSVTIPASVTSIGDFAFGYCTYLASVTIPVASLTYYGVSAFDNTAAGLKIYVPGSALSTYEAATNWSAYKDNFVGVYTLTYDLAGGTLPAGKSNPESYTAEDKNFLLNNPTKEGYAFAGWKYDYTEGNNTFNYTEVFVDVNPVWQQDFAFTATWVAEDATHKDLAKCRAEVDNPLYRGGSGNYVGYYYDGGYGIKVYDGETLLTYGTDYSYSMLVSLDGGDCEDLGEHCRVLLTGEGNYVGGLSADVVIVANSVNGKWGDLKWAYDNGTLTISRKDGVTEDVVMDPMSSTGEGYDSWLGIGSGIFSIVFEEGVKTIAETAFGYVGDGLHHYSNLATISLPSSLTEIGAKAFAHCDGLTVDLDDILAKNITLGNNAFYKIGCLAGSLANNADNTEKIALLYQAARANVTLSDRTLYKDGNWNTLCLPFALGNAMADEGHHFDGTPLEGATVMELKVADSEFDAASGTLSLFFTDAKSISAGTPYIVKWEGDGTNNLVNPLFTGVKVFTDAPTPVQSNDEKVQFRGIYSSTNIYSADHDNLFLGIGKNAQDQDVSMLFWPNTTDYTLGAFRAYFHVDLTGGANVREFNLNFGEETSEATIISPAEIKEIAEKADAAWYTINGVRLSAKPTAKGLYVHGNRKVVIK